MDSDHDQLHERIIPLFPRRRSRPTPSPATPANDDYTDRILRIEAATGPQPNMTPGVHHIRASEFAASSGAFYPHTLTEDVPDAAAALGLSSIEVMLQCHGEYAPDFAETLNQRANHAGVRIYSVHTREQFHPFHSPYKRLAQEARDLFQQAIDLAATVGARVLVWHGPPRHATQSPAGWDHFLETTSELAAACGAAGMTLGLENVARCALSSVRDVTNFAREIDRLAPKEHLGYVFDPFQAAEAGANPFMMLASMGNRVVNVHISDMQHHKPTERHLVPGDGDLPWSALFRAIAGSGYNGPLMIEGPLGTDEVAFNRVRENLGPLIRSVFTFPPDGIAGSELPDGLRQGIALFNRHRYFEQHEVIEHEWHAERGPIRNLYQGILQIGVGLYHATNGNHRGAISLLTDGIAKTREFVPTALGINTGKLVKESQAILDQVIALGPDHLSNLDPTTFPQIEFVD